LDSGHQDGNYISAKDKHVIVIGGGDTGTDCVGTALRHGCKTLNQFEILPKPPDERGPDNPWPEWANIFRIDYGQEESNALFGNDPRSYLIMTEKFVGDSNGKVKELHTVDIDWDFSNGIPTPLKKEGTKRVWDVQLVLLAMGFIGPEDAIVEELKLDRDNRSNVKADHGEYTTNMDGVFVAGDMRRGQSLVVWAINEGRGAARECDRYLMGTSVLP
jgi:glutamate synthase (NADPH/NADH) small chain